MGLNDVRGLAADIQICVVNPRLLDDVLAQIVDAAVHELTGVQGASALLRRGSGVSAHALEVKPGTDISDEPAGHRHVRVARMPCEQHVEIVKHMRAGHEGLAVAGFLRRCAEKHNCAGHAALFKPFPGKKGSAERSCAQCAVTTAVTISLPGDLFFLRDALFLGQAGERVKFSRDADERPPASVHSLEGRRNAGDAGFDRKTFRRQGVCERFAAFELLVARLCVRPELLVHPGDRSCLIFGCL